MFSTKSRAGKLIAIEGEGRWGDSVEVADRIVSAMKAAYVPCIRVTSLGDGPIAMIIKQIKIGRIVAPREVGAKFHWQTMALLHAADRRDLVQTVVAPAIEEGTHVVVDQWIYSDMETFGSKPLLRNWVQEINRFSPNPDLTLVVTPWFRLTMDDRVQRHMEVSEFDGGMLVESDGTCGDVVAECLEHIAGIIGVELG